MASSSLACLLSSSVAVVVRLCVRLSGGAAEGSLHAGEEQQPSSQTSNMIKCQCYINVDGYLALKVHDCNSRLLYLHVYVESKRVRQSKSWN